AGEWGPFVEIAQVLSEQLDGAARSQVCADIGRVYSSQLDNEDEAIRWLRLATSGDQPSLEAARLLEKLHAVRGEWDEVVRAIDHQASASDGNDAVQFLLKAAEIQLETLHDRNGASNLYKRVLELDPGNSAALRFQSAFVYANGDCQAACELFERMEALQDARDLEDFDEQVEVGLYFFHFAEALLKLDRLQEALQRYERSLELNPNHLPTLEAVGPVYMEQGDWEKARDRLRRVLQLTGGQGDAERIGRTYIALGEVERELGDLDRAKKRFIKALELLPGDIRALQGSARVLFARGDWPNLLTVYNKIIQSSCGTTEKVQALLHKGFVLDVHMEMEQKAAQHFHKALTIDPEDPPTLLRLAELALRAKDWPDAASLADRGLQRTNAGAVVQCDLHLVRSIAHGACGDSQAARDAFELACSIDPEFATAAQGSEADPAALGAILTERLRTRP
ncbi:MAG: tetratricopeptide repeat protein, partial [Myxococcota bacterium]|nr:tetratricopeptide repeat protein [Myxococcota bacterium]